jgi:hypothetical protein
VPASGKEGEEDKPIGDLPEATLGDADRMLDTVYGGHIHQNDSTHLEGGIVNNNDWQEY